MSYCQSKRQQLMALIRYLEETLQDMLESGVSAEALADVRRRLKEAQSEMVTNGDCGD